MSFDRTRAALVEWDENKSARLAMMNAAADSAAVREWVEECDRQKLRVQLAFYADTKGVNRLEHAKQVHPDDPWLRDLVKQDA